MRTFAPLTVLVNCLSLTPTGEGAGRNTRGRVLLPERVNSFRLKPGVNEGFIIR
jgi:hypothetical protein